jgi:hypothetical protein
MLKHWLLNLAVEFPIWLNQLFPLIDAEGLNVKPVPGCNSEDYSRGLMELFDSGMIMLSSEESGDDTQSRSGVKLILDRFLKLASDDPKLTQQGRLRPLYQRNRLPGMQVSFKLTGRGGEEWEKLAEPDWPHILIVSVDSKSGDLFSPDRNLLMACLGWYEEIEKQKIALDTITWQTHSDFAILYWKHLPLVHHASFALQPGKPRWPSREPRWFREWYISAITWHKKPWDLPDWSSQ